MKHTLVVHPTVRGLICVRDRNEYIALAELKAWLPKTEREELAAQMAAAPELVAALKDVRDYLHSRNFAGHEVGALVLERVEAALAKAEKGG